MSGHRCAELIELRLDRFVSAGHDSDAFQFALLWIRTAGRDRRFACAYVRLTFKAQHCKRRPLWRSVEHGESHRSGVAPLVARIVSSRASLGPCGVRGYRLAQGVI